MTENLEFIRSLAAGNDDAYKRLYIRYYSMVSYLVLNNQGNEDDVKDVFQDVVIVLIERARSHDFQLKASLKTYIYSIARNIWYARARKKIKSKDFNDFESFLDFGDNEVMEKIEKEKRFEWIEKSLEVLGDPCKSLLVQFYYLKRSMVEIAQNLNYSNADHAKSQKYKCIQRLKKLSNA